MCDAKPGVRCATDTRGAYQRALTHYQASHPNGPSLDPLTAAHADWAPRHRRGSNGHARHEGSLSDRSRSRFRGGQSLALAVGLAHKLDLPAVSCAFDENHQLIRAWVMTEPDRMRDIDGERDFEAFAATLDRDHPGWSLEQIDTEDARAHSDKLTNVPQQWSSGTRIASELAGQRDDDDWWA